MQKCAGKSIGSSLVVSLVQVLGGSNTEHLVQMHTAARYMQDKLAERFTLTNAGLVRPISISACAESREWEMTLIECPVEIHTFESPTQVPLMTVDYLGNYDMPKLSFFAPLKNF